jgi:hypothetical protein
MDTNDLVDTTISFHFSSWFLAFYVCRMNCTVFLTVADGQDIENTVNKLKKV